MRKNSLTPHLPPSSSPFLHSSSPHLPFSLSLPYSLSLSLSLSLLLSLAPSLSLTLSLPLPLPLPLSFPFSQTPSPSPPFLISPLPSLSPFPPTFTPHSCIHYPHCLYVASPPTYVYICYSEHKVLHLLFCLVY